MSGARANPRDLVRGSRLPEWSILLAIVTVLALWLAQQTRAVQAQGELAAVRSTLGALRTALVLGHLRAALDDRPTGVSADQRQQLNPFMHLVRPPVNYLGELVRQDNAPLAAGTWVFDPVCTCVGYTPLNTDWFGSASGSGMAWFDVQRDAGIAQLKAREPYAWRGELLE